MGRGGAGDAPTALHVSGDLTAVGGIALGLDLGGGGMDEAERHGFILRRGGTMPQPGTGQSLSITVGGGIAAAQVDVYEGETQISGALTAAEGPIIVRGGQLHAQTLRTPGRLILGSADDYYGTNQNIAVTLGDAAEHDGGYVHHAGALTEGGAR